MSIDNGCLPGLLIWDKGGWATNLRSGSTRGQHKMKSAADVEAFVGHRRMEIGAAVAADE